MYLHIGTRSGQPKQFKILLALYYYIGSLVWLDGVRRDGYQFIWWWLIHWSGVRAMCPRCNGNFSTELLFSNFRNFYQVTSYKMHGWFGSSREKERREMVFIHNHISIWRRDGFQQNGFMSNLPLPLFFPFLVLHSCILIISFSPILTHTWV